MKAPGAIKVWSGGAPRLDVHRIPPERVYVILGREDAEVDDRISLRHARLEIVDSRLAITDLRSRNGTYADGMLLTEQTQLNLPAVLRAGRTVFVVVSDVRPYERAAVARRGGLPVAASLATTCTQIDDAVLAEDNLIIAGPREVGRGLARAYLDARGAGGLFFDPAVETRPLEELIGQHAPIRTIALDLHVSIQPTDLATLELWLETDVRVVATARSAFVISRLTPTIGARLPARVIEIPPTFRFDELPPLLADVASRTLPGRALHASAIERLLLVARTMDEDTLFERLAIGLADWQPGRDDLIRGDDLADALAPAWDPRHCLVG